MGRGFVKTMIVCAGGNSQVARELRIRPQAISRWIAKDRVPVDRVPQLAVLTGLPRHVLRPDRPDLFPPPRSVEAADRRAGA